MIYRGSFTPVVEAPSEKERDELLDKLYQLLSNNTQDLKIFGFYETENKWEDEE